MELFFNSIIGKMLIAVLVFIILLVALGLIKSKKKFNTKAMVYSAIAIAIATVLSQLKLIEMPQGGSITLFSMFFVVLIGYWFGPVQGILCGITYGLIQFMIKPYIVYPVQIILDYPIAYGMLGLSGFFCNKKDGLIPGYILGVFGRFMCSFLSGVIFFSDFAIQSGNNPIAYSISYNIAYIGGEAFLTAVVLLIPAVRSGINIVKRSAINA